MNLEDYKKRFYEISGIIAESTEEIPKLILPVGISGSGKSTWIRSHTTPNTVVICPDDIRHELTGDISNQDRNKEVFQIAYDRAVEALNNGKSVIFDETNLSSHYRKKRLEDLKKSVSREFIPVAKIFNADPEVSKKRIRKDLENNVHRSNVPEDVIDRQYRLFIQDISKIESDGYKIIE